MDKQLLVFVLIAHVLSDFQLQTKWIAEHKNKEAMALTLHGLIVFVMTMSVAVLYREKDLLISLGFIAVTHLLIDFTKSRLLEFWPKLAERNVLLFWIDQSIHILLISAVLFEANPVTLHLTHDRLYELSKLVLAFLLLTKPANIVIAMSTQRYRYEDEAVVNEGRPGAGALIGSLERILSAILLYSGELAAIGLIFTAKSIARFDRIQKDQRFAEYYLIGSLSSLLICFLVIALIRYLL